MCDVSPNYLNIFLVTMHQKELEQKCPQEGWVEQDPYAILEAVKTCILAAVNELVSLGGTPKVWS